MRNTIEFNSGWIFTPDAAESEENPRSSKIKLPFFHDAETMLAGTFRSKWTARDEHDGKTVYMEFSQLSADCEIFFDGKEVAVKKSSPYAFRVLLSLEVKAGEEYEIKIHTTPKARPDGMFSFAGLSLIYCDSSHFNMTETDKGIHLSTELTAHSARLTVTADVIRPNNYDIVSYTVLNSKGETVTTKTAKPTKPDTQIEFTLPELWDGQIGPYVYRLNAKLLRDSQCLDEIELPFGFKEITLKNDGFLYLNGFKLPLNGVKFTDCSAVKTDINNIRILDSNALLCSILPSKTNLLSVCDREGLLFWYEISKEEDRETAKRNLRDFLFLYGSHPSLTAVVIPTDDEEYFNELSDIIGEITPSVLPVIKLELEKAVQSVPAKAKTVMLSIPCKTAPEDLLNLSGRFTEIISKNPDRFFSVLPESPDKANMTPEELIDWHIRLWNCVCKLKGVIAYFGGLLSDGKALNSKRGLMSGDRQEIYDIFWYYKSQFSIKDFIKICELPQYDTYEKFIDIKCITNCNNLRILVNGKQKKYKAEKIADGLYIFRLLKLKKDVNIIEVSAGDECDSIEIIRI